LVSDIRGGTHSEGAEKDEIARDLQKIASGVASELWPSPNVIAMFRSRKLRWTGHVDERGTSGMHSAYWWESQKEIVH
jgi:hypothetical protein